MKSDITFYPFLIGCSLNIDYKIILMPKNLDEQETYLELSNSTDFERLSPLDTVFFRQVEFKKNKVKNFTVIFQIRCATKYDIGDTSDEILKDSYGRQIQLVEGVVISNLVPKETLFLTQKDLKNIHDLIINYYRNFWHGDTGIKISNPIALNPVSNSNHVVIEELNKIIIDRPVPPPTPPNWKPIMIVLLFLVLIACGFKFLINYLNSQLPQPYRQSCCTSRLH